MESVAPAAFKAVGAAAYIDVCVATLYELPIPRSDIRKPGALRPKWRWRRADLDAYLAERSVAPGQVSPWGE